MAHKPNSVKWHNDPPSASVLLWRWERALNTLCHGEGVRLVGAPLPLRLCPTTRHTTRVLPAKGLSHKRLEARNQDWALKKGNLAFRGCHCWYVGQKGHNPGLCVGRDCSWGSLSRSQAFGVSAISPSKYPREGRAVCQLHCPGRA